jgi:hypothetical protein
MAHTDYTWVVVDKNKPPQGYAQPVIDLTDLEDSVAKYWNGQSERRFSTDTQSFEKLFVNDKMTIRVLDIANPSDVTVQFLAYDPTQPSTDYVISRRCYDGVDANPEPDGFITKNNAFNSVLVRIGESLDTGAAEQFAIFVQGAAINFSKNRVSGTTNIRTGGGTPAGSSSRIPKGR